MESDEDTGFDTALAGRQARAARDADADPRDEGDEELDEEEDDTPMGRMDERLLRMERILTQFVGQTNRPSRRINAFVGDGKPEDVLGPAGSMWRRDMTDQELAEMLSGFAKLASRYPREAPNVTDIFEGADVDSARHAREVQNVFWALTGPLAHLLQYVKDGNLTQAQVCARSISTMWVESHAKAVQLRLRHLFPDAGARAGVLGPPPPPPAEH
eukprot:gnl/Trimastix_PCT/1857.p1 GENE.gnl/Trimastix_PCT/1857~~gnl/Trimastix_PCT/1857.p1  ORF type:complete len:215 (-),score=25.73 gnl/Trimastix_PCT/1857:10-654(-)